LNIPAYLERIAYTGPITPSTQVLRDLHRAHMLAVPFENLDIGLGRKIICDEETILRKIVEQRRGGFCYELNGAFAALLRELGFNITLLSARVARQDGSEGPEFDHLALRVDLEEPWLADVGFGDSFLEPLPLRVDVKQPQDRRKFRLVEEGGSLHMDMADPDEWKRQYSFTLIPRQLGEFAGMCHYHQTSPKSSFTQKRICSRATADGRITVADGKLIVTRNNRKEESELHSDREWREALKKYFGIVI
jgi:N-hydroxyarylamine O-acetyltransferase